MYDRLPDTLFRTKRGLCPSCGAPLPLGEDTSNISCGFCGARAVLERRLRRTEPEVAGAPLRQFDRHDHAGWERTSRLSEQYAQRATCPGCGLGLGEPEHGERYMCGGCGTESHMERRLVPPPVNPLRGTPRPRHPGEVYAFDLGEDEEAGTEHLIWRLSREADPDKATPLAAWFEHWAHVNETTSRLMPAILERMDKAGRAGHRPLVFELSSAVDKCLCSEGAKLKDTIAALEEWVVRVPAERQLLSSLGLGPAMGLKLLLDSSMLAHKAGDLSQSVAALFGINWMLQRNYPQHEIISQILMHRMFYLSGPPLAFCVMFMHGQVSDVAFRYDPKTTLSFLDDAVAERPCLVPSLDHERAFWCGEAKSEAEWRERKAFVDALRTDEAKVAAWRWYLWPPKDASPEFYEEYGRLAVGLMDDERPAFKAVGEMRVEKIIRQIKPCPGSVMALVAERGESLPGEIRRAFLGEHPQCGLSYRNLPNWQSEPKPEEHPEIVEGRRLYKEGLTKHLAEKTSDRDAWKAYWDARGGRPTSPPAVFDGVNDGPAPAEARPRERARYPRPWEDHTPQGAADGSRRSDESSDRPAPGDETAPPPSEPEAGAREELPDAPGSSSFASASESDQAPAQPNDSVTIWEFVASLPEDQRAAYQDTLKAMEPYRAQIEAAIAQQRGQVGRGVAFASPQTDDAPNAASADVPQGNQPTPEKAAGLLGRLFGKGKK